MTTAKAFSRGCTVAWSYSIDKNSSTGTPGRSWKISSVKWKFVTVNSTWSDWKHALATSAVGLVWAGDTISAGRLSLHAEKRKQAWWRGWLVGPKWGNAVEMLSSLHNSAHSSDVGISVKKSIKLSASTWHSCLSRKQWIWLLVASC